MKTDLSSARIVDRNPEVEGVVPRRKNAKWTILFDPLPYNKAIILSFSSYEEARRVATACLQTLRKGRATYKVHTRVIPNNSEFQAYIWKEKVECQKLKK